MDALLVFSLALLAAVLLSERASRSVLSSSLLFLVVGFSAGPGMAGWIDLRAGDNRTERLAEVALFAVLFSDGMRIGVRELASAWRLPGRALLLGFPMTLIATGLLARWLVGLPWTEAFLLGAILAPTDPVFAAAIVGRRDVPYRLRRLLNVESGLNDGLALPLVLGLLAVAVGAERSTSVFALFSEIGLGVLLGILIPLSAISLERTRYFASHDVYEPLLALSIALVLYALTVMTHANTFLAAFAGGVTVASLRGRVREDFHQLGESLSELLKLAALLVFGAMLTPELLGRIELADLAFALLLLFAVRPIAVAVALVRSPLPTRPRLAAAWFGPKGFASVVYALHVLHSALPERQQILAITACVIALSIALHSSSDVLVARWLEPDRDSPRADTPRSKLGRGVS